MASHVTITFILCFVVTVCQASSQNRLAKRIASLERTVERLNADLVAERIKQQQNVSEYNRKLDGLKAEQVKQQQQISEFTRKLRDEQDRAQTLEKQIIELRERFDQKASPSTNALTTAAPTTATRNTAAPTTAASTPNSSSAAKSHSVQACLRSSNCWVQYNFKYDRNYTACGGAQYVTQTPYSVGRYIGAVLCTSTRYKLVMADDLEDIFLNVGDGSGAGEDLCDLIGGSKDAANLPSDFWDSPSANGFRIIASGFEKGMIGFGPPWTGHYFPTWYECRGVSIPGSSQVIQLPTEGATTATSVTTTPTTTEQPSVESTVTKADVNWGKAKFGQLKFVADGVFVVPEGVRLVDVICIGHSALIGSPGYGGNGGNSAFGEYVWAEGGKGALRNDSGGEGGRGMTRDGGQGGIGGGCSAGAGAAGQTSGGGGGLIGGSSSLPFCGGGGSSGGSSCGTEFGGIGAATSGPGGQDPEGRGGGLYGGGGGSRAGGRAGGGGGYSRATISVTPGQTENVTVGRTGTPHYQRPGPGLVVVSWGGPINPLFGG